jgi:hypothetical protein
MIFGNWTDWVWFMHIVMNWRLGDVSVHHAWTAVRVELFCLNVCARVHVGGCGKSEYVNAGS